MFTKLLYILYIYVPSCQKYNIEYVLYCGSFFLQVVVMNMAYLVYVMADVNDIVSFYAIYNL